jgi:hypothetical protein
MICHDRQLGISSARNDGGAFSLLSETLLNHTHVWPGRGLVMLQPGLGVFLVFWFLFFPLCGNSFPRGVISCAYFTARAPKKYPESPHVLDSSAPRRVHHAVLGDTKCSTEQSMNGARLCGFKISCRSNESCPVLSVLPLFVWHGSCTPSALQRQPGLPP